MPNIFEQMDTEDAATKPASGNIFEQMDTEGGVEDVASRANGEHAPKGMWDSAVEKIRGRQDPQYKDIPSFNTTDASLRNGMQTPLMLGMLGGAGDAAFGDIIQKQLGDKFVRRFKDANGYDIIEHTATPDGKPTMAYVSKPGLDTEGVVRGAVGAIPYAVGGAGAAALKVGNAAMKTAPWFLRLMMQGGVAGSTNVAGQVGQMALGSEQPFDKTQSALATAAGGLTEVLPSKALAPIAGGVAGLALTSNPDDGISAKGTIGGIVAGTAAQMLARRMLRMNPTQWVKPDGTLTQRAQDVAKAANIDISELKGAVAQDWGKAMAATRDPVEAVVSAESRNGIPMTAGQRSKDYQQLVLEDQMRAGQKGIPAQQEIKRFDDMQRKAVEDSAFGGQYATPHGPPSPPTIASQPPTATGWPSGTQTWAQAAPPPPPAPQIVKPGVTATLNPVNGVKKPPPDWLNQFGESAQGGLQEAQQSAKQSVREAWKGADDLKPTPAAMDMLPDQIQAALKANKIAPPVDEKSASQQMLALLRDYRAGRSPGKPDEFVPDLTGQNVNEIRKQLGVMTRSAKDDQDRAVAGAIYKGYNDWLDAAANAGHFPADIVGAIRSGRAMSKEVKDLFEPMFKGRPTPAANMIEKAIQSDSAEGVINSLLGQGPTNSIQFGRVQALSKMRDAMSKFAPGNNAWNDLRTAYVNRMLMDKNGSMHSYDMIANNIERSYANQKSVWNVLMGPDEQKLLLQLGRDTRRISTKEIAPKFRTNSSGSGFAVGAMVKDSIENLFKALGQSKTAGALFGVAKGLPGAKNLAQKTSEQYNLAAARQAVSQMPKESVPSFGPYGSAAFGATRNAFDDNR